MILLAWRRRSRVAVHRSRTRRGLAPRSRYDSHPTPARTPTIPAREDRDQDRVADTSDRDRPLDMRPQYCRAGLGTPQVPGSRISIRREVPTVIQVAHIALSRRTGMPMTPTSATRSGTSACAAEAAATATSPRGTADRPLGERDELAADAVAAVVVVGVEPLDVHRPPRPSTRTTAILPARISSTISVGDVRVCPSTDRPASATS